MMRRLWHHLSKPVHTTDDLVNLDRFQAIVKMQTSGKTLPAFSLSTSPPMTSKRGFVEQSRSYPSNESRKVCPAFEEVESEFVERFQDERLRLAKESAAEVSYLG